MRSISMVRITLIATMLLVGLAPIAAIAADDHVVVSADQLKWAPAPPAFPKGAQIAVLAGNPAADGLYVYRLKLPAGYKVPPHFHPFDENVTVISGTFNIGMGATFDEKKWSSPENRRLSSYAQRHAALRLVYRRNDHSVSRYGSSRHYLREPGRRSSKG
jgi:hypothetical protein